MTLETLDAFVPPNPFTEIVLTSNARTLSLSHLLSHSLSLFLTHTLSLSLFLSIYLCPYLSPLDLYTEIFSH
jgi:hypothetical protein